MSYRQFTEDKLIIASHNPGKVREIGELLGSFGVEVVSASDLNLPEPEETGETFVANAQLKSEAAAKAGRLRDPGHVDQLFFGDLVQVEPVVHARNCF